MGALLLHGMGGNAAAEGAAPSLFGAARGGLSPDPRRAAEWARRAADNGSADGKALLAYILTSGPEEMRDLATATDL